MTLQLVVSGLEVKRGARSVIRDLSFAVAGGEALLLTGANGAGKTTLIRSLAGLLKPAAGTIRLGPAGPEAGVKDHGADDDREVYERCHYVGHLNSIKSSFTVAENLEFWARYLGDGDGSPATFSRAGEGRQTRTGVEAALEQFNLVALADIPASYLSAGQKRRLGLARLLVSARPVWLLDEPTVSLDKESVRLVAGAVDAHVAGGGMVIAATHLDLGLAAARELRLGAAEPKAA